MSAGAHDAVASIDAVIAAHETEVSLCGQVYTDLEDLKATRAAIAKLIAAMDNAVQWIADMRCDDEREHPRLKCLRTALRACQGGAA